MNYEIREIANYIIAQPKLPYCKVVIHRWLIHSSILYSYTTATSALPDINARA